MKYKKSDIPRYCNSIISGAMARDHLEQGKTHFTFRRNGEEVGAITIERKPKHDSIVHGWLTVGGGSRDYKTAAYWSTERRLSSAIERVRRYLALAIQHYEAQQALEDKLSKWHEVKVQALCDACAHENISEVYSEMSIDDIRKVASMADQLEGVPVASLNLSNDVQRLGGKRVMSLYKLALQANLENVEA